MEIKHPFELTDGLILIGKVLLLLIVAFILLVLGTIALFGLAHLTGNGF